MNGVTLIARIASATGRPCDNSTSTCLSFATISSGLCFFCGIPGILQRLESLLQGGPLFRGQTRRSRRQYAKRSTLHWPFVALCITPPASPPSPGRRRVARRLQLPALLQVHPELGLVPNAAASRSAVSPVTARRPAAISLIRFPARRSRRASALADRPSGVRNSSASTSPGCTGASRPGRGSAIVADLDVIRVSVLPAKGNPELVVDPDGVLPGPVALAAPPAGSPAARAGRPAPSLP